ncbi:MAG TPA: GNAT family protein [Beijerinckiaceae bacterium]|jgi:RimJ/RimL family protein N-acetyltransferase
MTLIPGAQRALHLLSSARLSDFRHKVGERVRSGPYKQLLGYGLRRDLSVPFDNPKAKIPIEVRELVASDVPALFADAPDGHPNERLELAWRREVVTKALPTCYVAVDSRNGTPCYVQWLIGAAQNPRLHEIGRFPQLRNDEALLENAYTPAAYRGLGIMPAAMALIAERAADLGARYVITFVGHDNVPSLKGCERAGFKPYITRRQTEYGFGLISTLVFEPLPERSYAA